MCHNYVDIQSCWRVNTKWTKTLPDIKNFQNFSNGRIKNTFYAINFIPNFSISVMPSPSSNYTQMQNPMMSPAPSINQMVPSPGSVRCAPQMMSPNMQNCGMNQMVQQNQCYSRPMSANHNMCYVQHQNWDNGMQMSQNRMCPNPGQMQQNHNMCHSQSTNVEYGQCRQAAVSNG